jgi:hypothetical protein
VPGRNNAVKMAMIFIFELSLARAFVRFSILVVTLACNSAWLRAALFVAKDAWFAAKLERDAS